MPYIHCYVALLYETTLDEQKVVYNNSKTH
jgi:hypothetical protein